ncbi:hypothetical protein AAC387_Pa02g4923 [Persea americana]
MRLAISVVKKCQLGIGRLAEAETKAAERKAEKEELQKALEAKDKQLREEVSKSANLAVDLEKAQAEVEQLEVDVHLLRRANVDLVTERNKERAKRPNLKSNVGPSSTLLLRRGSGK